MPYGYNFNGRRSTSGRYEPGETANTGEFLA